MVVLRSVALLALAASLAFSGCLSSGTTGSANLEGIPAGHAASGPNAGTASTHGEPKRSEGSVSVDREGDQYVARQTVTITNDFGGAAESQVTLKTGAGGVASRAWSEGGYKTVALLQARASSEAAARDALGDISLTHTDHLAAGKLVLTTQATMPSSNNGVSRGATITANLPQEPAYDILLRSGSGGADSSGLGGPAIDASTGSGGVSVHGSFGLVKASTGSGGIELAGVANDVSASTGSGGVEASLKPGASSSWTFHTGSGGVEVELGSGSGIGYDVDATAGSGGVSVDLHDGEDVGSQTRTHRHVRSQDYDQAAIKVQVHADAGSGGVDVEG